MGTSDFQKFSGSTQDKGVNNFEPDIGAEITWDQTTVNVTGGVSRGVGVRYGVAPLAMHSNTLTMGNACNGLQLSESTVSVGQGLIQRKHIYGIVPLTFGWPSLGTWPKPNAQYYAYLVGLNDSSNTTLDVCIGCEFSSTTYDPTSTFAAGLAASSYRQESPLARRHKTELLNLPQTSTPTAADMQTILRSVSSRYWIPYANISVSGKRVPYQWMLGDVVADPASGVTPSINIWTAGFTSGSSGTFYCGAPSEIITREAVDNYTRTMTVYCYDTSGYWLDLKYEATITNANTSAVLNYGTSAMYAAVSGTQTGASTAYSSVETVLINDPGSYTNSRHDAVLMAGEIPIAVVYQDWLKAVNGMMPRWVDLSNPGCTPRILGPNLLGLPDNEGSAMPNAVPQEGASGTGVLRLDGTYQFGFSVYDKLIDYETNVYLGCQKVIEGGDFCSVSFIGIPGGVESMWELFQTSGPTLNYSTFPWEYSPTTAHTGAYPARGLSINDYEMRVYYRESGTAEWLPGGSIDAAKAWFFPITSESNQEFCTGPAAFLPGGQPNGFNDYSPLPKQRYICTTVFQQRAFWWSEKSMHFSYANNIYAYPLRNIVACPTGKWRGGIVHSQKDLSQQLSRLVVFGDQTYSARFTGQRTVQSVRVSSTTVGQFELDGSDFRMEYLCESTAFSFRAACVGEGVLYWWGPQGVYRDDGMTPPRKISSVLEPDIWDLVNMDRDTEVHCVYNKRTMEVIWFYPPRVADATFPTYGLTYNTENGKFYNFKMRCKVDASQNIKLENNAETVGSNPSTPAGVSGERILLHCRETTASTIQRTFYFDDIVEAGEQGPARELTVSTVATPSAGTRRLTLAAGSIGVTAGSIAVNDLICIQNARGYAPALTLADDMIAKVTAINNGSSYIDILLPEGAAFDASASLTAATCFPIYHKKPTAAGLHGITYLMQTNYWLPDGLSNAWNWLYLYMLFKYSGIPTPTDPFTSLPVGARINLLYRTLVCAGALTDELRLRDNSAGHCQIHHPLRNEGRAANGQALAYGLSGIHIGNPWTLEYLEAHCQKERGFTLKEFEG